MPMLRWGWWHSWWGLCHAPHFIFFYLKDLLSHQKYLHNIIHWICIKEKTLSSVTSSIFFFFFYATMLGQSCVNLDFFFYMHWDGGIFTRTPVVSVAINVTATLVFLVRIYMPRWALLVVCLPVNLPRKRTEYSS